MEELTAKEEEVMQILWDLNKALVRDIMSELPNSKQPYTTVASIVRILEKKGYVSHKPYGKTHEYYPLVSKAEYRRRKFKGLLTQYFDNSIESVVSFLAKEEKLSPKEFEELTKMIAEESENEKKDDDK
ncbi:MAG: BlaI/MecI/CopY family transcriptional regulator [Bacteroidetes bacterium]|nr:MAG: BlaI/MecI/CopY family transcriptional regulator [Bacteroidota bacterium]RLD91053.1 MAG: BlaI/MecI/CopY family transcriptional regulator [Bacteroidota bacterium]